MSSGTVPVESLLSVEQATGAVDHGERAQTYDVDGKPANRSFHLVAHCDDTFY